MNLPQIRRILANWKLWSPLSRTPASRPSRHFRPSIEEFEDRCVPTTFTVTNTGDNGGSNPLHGAGTGTLRQAIVDSNFAGGSNTINFNISGSGVQIINLAAALPTITATVVINATSQPLWNNSPLIELNGGSTSSLNNGITTGLQIASSASGSTIQGLDIVGFSNYGIELDGGDNVVEQSIIGLLPNGTAKGNAVYGVYINNSAGNTIGFGPANTSTAINADLISGNGFGITGANSVSSGGAGVGIVGSGSTGNVVWNNLIGTASGGESDTGTGNDIGVLISGASSNSIGGTAISSTAFFGNVISGNSIGVQISGGSSNQVLGNIVGLDLNRVTALANQAGIIVTGSTGNLIGSANTISGNATNGVALTAGSSGNTIQSNFIGTGLSGTTAIANVDDGVVIDASNSNIIGGTTAALGNVISGNTNSGIEIQNYAAFNVVEGNLIGTNTAGTGAIGTVSTGNVPSQGIILDSGANNNTVGSTISGAGNVISSNQTGVALLGIGTSANLVIGNAIGTNQARTGLIGNTYEGVLIEGANNNTVGGTTSAAANLIVGTIGGPLGVGNGVVLGPNPAQGNVGAFQNLVEGNTIGGTGALANSNSGNGVVIDSSFLNTIGGTATGASNLISNNTDRGIAITGSNGVSNQVLGNTIDSNGFQGVYVTNGASSNTIGGTATGAGNTIAFNGSNGVLIGKDSVGPPVGPSGPDTDAGTGNAILSNSIFTNTSAGIALTGASNNAQAAPVLTSAILSNTGSATSPTITLAVLGTLTSTANTSFTVQFFANNSLESNQGATLLASMVVTTNGSGVATIQLNPVAVTKVNPFAFVTATATSLGTNNTSAFGSVQVSPTLLSDPLNVNNPTGLDANWNVFFGQFSITGGSALGATQTYPHGNLAEANLPTPLTSPANVSLSIDFNLAATPTGPNGRYAGLLARIQDPSDFYAAFVYYDSTTSTNLVGVGYQLPGPFNSFVSTVQIPVTATSGTLRFDLYGTSLQVYVNGVLEISTTDSHFTTAGGIGFGDAYIGGTKFNNFVATSLEAPTIPFTDSFTRANASTLGDPYSVNTGSFSISSNRAAAAASLASTATLYGTALSTLDESVLVNTAGSGLFGGGLLARWNATTNSGYMAVLTSTGQAEILAVQNLGTPSQNITSLGSAAAASSGSLEFKLTGTTLQLFFNGNSTPLLSLTNSLFSSGGVGIGSTAGGSLFGTYSLLSGS
jgi:hypothetical protein